MHILNYIYFLIYIIIIQEKRNLKSYSTYKYNVEVGLVNFFKVDKVMFSVIDGKKALN